MTATTSFFIVLGCFPGVLSVERREAVSELMGESQRVSPTPTNRQFLPEANRAWSASFASNGPALDDSDRRNLRQPSRMITRQRHEHVDTKIIYAIFANEYSRNAAPGQDRRHLQSMSSSNPTAAPTCEVVTLPYDDYIGACNMCGTTDKRYMCSNGYPGPWNNGRREFTQPIPNGNIVTSVSTRVIGVWGCEANDGDKSRLTGRLQGYDLFSYERTGQHGNCHCGQCGSTFHWEWQSSDIPSTILGFPGYNYSGMNAWELLVTNNTGACVSQVELTLCYEADPLPDILRISWLRTKTEGDGVATDTIQVQESCPVKAFRIIPVIVETEAADDLVITLAHNDAVPITVFDASLLSECGNWTVAYMNSAFQFVQHNLTAPTITCPPLSRTLLAVDSVGSLLDGMNSAGHWTLAVSSAKSMNVELTFWELDIFCETTNAPSSSASPSVGPSSRPTEKPSQGPSLSPSQSAVPTNTPSSSPSSKPSQAPSREASSGPTSSQSPSDRPSSSPSLHPSTSQAPSQSPSDRPSSLPSLHPSTSQAPSQSPSLHPSTSQAPSFLPSTSLPSHQPTLSLQPSQAPSPVWQEIFAADFEMDFGPFVDGVDANADLNTRNAHNGAQSLRLRDSAQATTRFFTVSMFTELRVHFFYQTKTMEDEEDGFALEYKANYWGSWNEVERWISGVDFVEVGEWKEVFVSLPDASEIDLVQLRFRCLGNENNDKVNLDDLTFQGRS